ncbi:MAG: Rieske 2Fe-2S domain-containing protein [Gemmatimonadetes bacterium]|nr:Rieske 2Fe-2S domain-containing protein [Gemmatimonadota bacterium]
MPRHFAFSPDIATASTIPARLYTDPVYLELEQERIFGRTWQLAARTEQLEGTGAFVVADVAGESIVIVRDGTQLRAFHNICLHRAGPVATGCGRRQTLQCRYHGWTYALDGSLKRAPEMEGTAHFRPEEMRLLPVQVAAFGPLVLVNLDTKAPPLAHFLEDIPARTAHFGLDAMRYVQSKRWTVACNWKVYVDNYLEGYHLPVVHPGLNKELDYDQYRVEPHRWWSLQHAPLRPVRAGDDTRTYTPRDAADEAQYYWLFPNLMLNVYQGQMQLNLVLPDGPDRTTVVYDWYATEPPAAGDAQWAKLLAFSDEIQEEDITICEAVQRNLRSRVYERGRYSATRENGVHHFHGLLHEFLQ